MGGKAASDAVMAMLWALAYGDGSTSLVEVADRADLDVALLRAAADDLLGAGLLAPARTPSTLGEERPGRAAGPS
jgi:aminopeptidase-like protein